MKVGCSSRLLSPLTRVHHGAITQVTLQEITLVKVKVVPVLNFENVWKVEEVLHHILLN
jgi:hypothetical protein